MGSREEMRAADGDRERYAERVKQALEEGRLTLTEMDERLREVYGARTFGELDRLVADLPGTVPTQRAQMVPADQPAARVPASRHEELPRLAPWLSTLWRLWLAVVVANLAIWFIVSVATGGLVYFWPIWVAGPWGIANVALTIAFPPGRRRST